MRKTIKQLATLIFFAVSACANPAAEGDAPANFSLKLHKVTPELIASLNAKHAPAEVAAPVRKRVDEAIYKVGPGDVLFVKISALSSRTEQSGDGLLVLTGIASMPSRQIGQQVTRDGLIQVPIVGRVYAEGKTIRELNEEITERMMTLYKHPTVEVKLLEYNSQRAFITGEVAKPGVIEIDNRPIHVLELIEHAGGVKETADLHNATVTRANGQVVPLDLASLILRGDSRYNLMIEPGDTLNIPGNHQNKFFVFGEGTNPKQQTMRPDGKSLAEALNELDPNEITHNNMVHIIRGAADDSAIDAAIRNHEQEGAYAAALKHVDVYTLSLDTFAGYALADKFRLQPRDIVYLPSSNITQWSRFISQLIPVTVTNAVISGTAVRNSTE